MSGGPLSSTQIGTLAGILANTNLPPIQRATSYFQALASYGIPYGNFALQVANNSTELGQIVNNFTAIGAMNNGATFNATTAAKDF
jgi:hypothetical protein